jgi:diguanylate cyclase
VLFRSAAIRNLQVEFANNQQEVGKLRQELERVRADALVDPLTGVANRRGFELGLAAMVQAPCPPGAQHFLLMLDIDHFKKVNDQHGHLVGDQVLRALGGVLRAEMTTTAGCTASRYGGEEFAVLLPGATLEGSKAMAERIRNKTRSIRMRSRATQAVVGTFTVSAGLSAFQPGEDSDALIARADAALYQSKTSGRDRLSVR